MNNRCHYYVVFSDPAIMKFPRCTRQTDLCSLCPGTRRCPLLGLWSHTSVCGAHYGRSWDSS